MWSSLAMYAQQGGGDASPRAFDDRFVLRTSCTITLKQVIMHCTLIISEQNWGT